MTAPAPSTIEASLIIVNWKVRELLRQPACSSVIDEGGLTTAWRPIRCRSSSWTTIRTTAAWEMVRAEFPQVELVANRDNVGFGKANNQALPMCKGRHVVLLNPDTKVLDGAMKKLVEIMDAEPSVAVLGCRLLNGDGTLQRWTGGAYPRLLNLFNHYFFLDQPAAALDARDAAVPGPRRGGRHRRGLAVRRADGHAHPRAERPALQPRLLHVRRGHGAVPPPEAGRADGWSTRRACPSCTTRAKA